MADPRIPRGLPTTDPAELLARATPEQISLLSKDSFAIWAQFSGIEVDNHKFDFDKHRYLLPLYLDQSKELTLIKAAQMGATIYMLLYLLWFARHNSVKVGLYFPTGDGVSNLSKDRLTPLLRSSKELAECVVDDVDTIGLKHIKNIEGKISSLYMLYLGGQASKDSVPLDAICFDEVRLVKPTDIDQAFERISHSEHKLRRYMSTAGFPDEDIDKRFKTGQQLYWHVKCRCFPLDQKVVVRRKGGAGPEPRSLRQLRDCWQDYEALSWCNRRKQWQYKPITMFHDNGTAAVVRGRFRNGASVICTPDHVFFQYSGQKNKKLRELAIKDIPYDSSSETMVNHRNAVLVACALPDNGQYGRAQGRTTQQLFPADNDTLYLLGAYVAEGSWKTDAWVQMSQLEGKPIHSRAVAWAQANCLPYKSTKTYVSIGMAGRPDLQQLFGECRRGCENKKFPDALLSAPTAQLRHALNGYRAGDGHLHSGAPDKRGFARSATWSAVTTSSTLKDQLVFIGLRLGEPLHASYAEPADKRPIWTVTCNPASVFAQRVEEEGMSWVSMKALEDAGEAEVADIAVADNHNYVLADSGLLVHNCPDGFIPSDVFPDCIADTGKEVYLRCPKCATRIRDPQHGSYVAHNPKAEFPSYHISQLISKFISPKEIWTNYLNTTNKREFYNAKLGRPYIDAENQPVNDEVLESCTNTDLSWAASAGGTRDLRKNCALGVDQMGGFNYVVIGKRGPDGKKQIVHLEIIEQQNPKYWEDGRPVTPFKRLYELMKEYDVGLCVIDAMPNVNEAQDFARTFPGRVFLGWYGDAGVDMVKWQDKLKLREQIRKGSKELKLKWQVVMHRYQTLDYALQQFIDREVVMPHPDALLSVVRSEETGRFEMEPIARRFRKHLRSLVRQRVMPDENTGKEKMQYIYIGGDPHFAHAFNYFCVAIERLKRVPMFVMG